MSPQETLSKPDCDDVRNRLGHFSMSRPRIFLSAVSTELRSMRQSVARTVRTLGYDPVVQDDFPTGHGELRQWLREQIDGCEGVIQLVGDAYGAEPPDVDPHYGRVSYTQFELLYAIEKGKKTWVIVIGERCSRDQVAAQLDLPDGAAGLDLAATQTWQAERRKLQQTYLDRLVRENHLRHTATDDTSLENIVLKLRDEFATLRREDEIRQRRLWQAVVAVLIGLMAGGWWVTRDLSSTVQQAAVVNTEKIRAHLLTTIEETHRHELVEADAARDWRERKQRREAADAAHAARRMRVDELAASFAEIEARGSSTSVFQELSRILSEQGVDEAIAYMAAQKPSILQTVRARAAVVRERNRRELEPLLRTAALYEAKGQWTEACSLYTEILEIEPDWAQALHAAFWFYTQQGDRARSYSSLAEASSDYQEAHLLAKQLANSDPANTEWQRDLSVSHDRIGEVLMAQGDGAGALAAYREGQAINEALAGSNPDDTKLQRDLAASHISIGDVLVAQGEGPNALTAFKRALEITEGLVAREPNSIKWQHDVAASHQRIGDVLIAQGDNTGALAALRQAHGIAATLAELDPANAEWQHSLTILYQRIGDVLIAQGDRAAALMAFHKALEISEARAGSDPTNMKWQHNAAASQARIGDVLLEQGEHAEALMAFRNAEVIAATLAARDVDNTEWHFALTVAQQRIGDVLMALGKKEEAVAAFRQVLPIADGLARRDPANTEWQRVLSASHQRIGDVLVSLGDSAGAQAEFSTALGIATALAGRDTKNARWWRDVATIQQRIGDVLMVQCDGAGGLSAYRKALAISETLAERDPTNTQLQVDLAISFGKFGSHAGLPVAQRRAFLLRGRKILQALGSAGLLPPSQDHVALFDAALTKLPSQ